MVSVAVLERKPMPVDRPARDLVGRAIQSYVRGEIDNFQFDDALENVRTSDPLINEIIVAAWYFYDDVRPHPFARSEDDVRHRKPWLDRWSQLLKAEVDFDAPERLAILKSQHKRRGLWGLVNDLFYGRQPAFASNAFWPLSSEREWHELGIPFVHLDALIKDSRTEGTA